MVHDPEVGAIVVGSPTPFHAEQIMEAAKLGKHIFCEKVREWTCYKLRLPFFFFFLLQGFSYLLASDFVLWGWLYVCTYVDLDAPFVCFLVEKTMFFSPCLFS